MTRTGEIVASNFDKWHAECSKWLLPMARKVCKGAKEIDPGDLVQETLLRFIERFGGSLDELDPTRADGWLIRTMTNYFYDLKGGAVVRTKATDDPTITRWTLAQEAESATYESISQERFDWAVNKLPELQRVTFLLRAKGLGNKEIARQLRASPGAVAKRLLDARRNLKELLTPYLDGGAH